MKIKKIKKKIKDFGKVSFQLEVFDFEGKTKKN